MDQQQYLADFARWLDAGASTVVGNPDDLAAQFLTARSQRQQLIVGNKAGD